METILSIGVGIALSAACGFRIFVPFLIMSIAANSGHLNLAQGFAWIGSPAALAAFSVATILEVAGYYVPWVDNLLDAAATPVAVVAGIIVTASMVTDVSPFMRWSLAVIAGGGAAGAVQASTVIARGLSLTGTGGLGNPVVATAELGGSLVVSILSLFIPILALVLVAGAIGYIALKFVRRSSRITL